MTNTKQTEFGEGSIPKTIVKMAIPLMAAQFVNVLYNIVDRIYIGNIPNDGSLALAGLGVSAPVILVISAFSGLLGTGGVPFFSIERGKGNHDEAERIMGTSFSLIVLASAVLMAAAWALITPALRLFGASEDIMPFARPYLAVYIVGTPFALLSTGMNGYINSQGFPRRGMFTVVIGAIANIILDPVFIFMFDMGVKGAAWATVLSQAVSALWCLDFLVRGPGEAHLHRNTLGIAGYRVKRILSLGITNFTMSFTNALTQAVANRELAIFGDEWFLGAYVIINSVRTLYMETIHGFTHGMQPVIGFNLGAGKKDRVMQCIRFTVIASCLLALFQWSIIQLFPRPIVRIFTDDERLLSVGIDALRIHFCASVFMSLQSTSQGIFVGLGMSKKAICFSLLRKVVIVTPLVFILPRLWGLGAYGVFWSEPVSDVLGGLAAFTTMLITVYFPIRRELKEEMHA